MTQANDLTVSRCDWTTWGSPAISDALRQLGKPFQAMDGGIRPVIDEMGTAGPAYTVRCYPGATWAMEHALEEASAGDVLVVDAGGGADVIIMGGLMAARAAARRLAGVIVDGAVRDVDQIAETGLPVFSRHVSPRGGTYAEIGEWQTTVCCGRLPVRPGDWIVGDRSGVAVVPHELLQQAACEARQIHERERRMAEQLRAGRSLAESAAAARERQAE